MRKLLFCALIAGCLGVTVAAEDQPKERARFDTIVREDLFAGFQGDDEALQRGIKNCEEALKKDPKNAEALVWRGAARVFSAGQKFGKGKPAEGFPLWTTGLKDMDDAVKLEPKNIGVRIPRAAVLLPAARNAPPAMGKPLLKSALEDFETIAKLQNRDKDALSTHQRGELAMGLADVYRLLGEREKSKEQLEGVVKNLPDSKYAKRATEWLAAKPDAKLAHDCIGCHVPKK